MQWTIFNLETEYIIGSFRDQEEVRIISLRLGSSAGKVFSRVSLINFGKKLTRSILSPAFLKKLTRMKFDEVYLIFC